MGRRRLYCIGDVGVPESDVFDDVTNGAKTQSEHQILNMVWDLASNAGRLFYKNSTGNTPSDAKDSLQAGSAAGALAGLYALRHAALGRATEGMNNCIRHVESLDQCFLGQGIRIAKVVNAGAQASGPSVMLLSSGVMLSLSKDHHQHGMAIPLPVEGSSADGGTSEMCRVLDVAAGAEHFLCCDDQGRVYSWGTANDYGQLGLGYTGMKGCENTPTRIPGFGEDVPRAAYKEEGGLPYSVMAQRPAPTACAVACGRYHSVLLSATKTCIWTFGRGHKGQLGLGKDTKGALLNSIDICPSPRSVGSLFGYPVNSIHCAADSDHTIVLLEAGSVVSFGDNTMGVCGTGSCNSLRGPTLAAFVDRSGDVRNLVCVDKNEAKRKQALSTPYGSPESYLFAKRLKHFNNEPQAGFPLVKSLSTSGTHTVVIAEEDGKLGCYSSGLRPIRVVQNDSHVDALGALGRGVGSKCSALAFGRMQYGNIVAEAGKRGATGNGTHIKVTAGSGFSTMMESSDPSTIWLHGAITVGGSVLVGTSKKRVDNTRRPTPSPAVPTSTLEKSPSPSLSNQDDETNQNTAAVLSLGPGRKAVDIFALGNGLLILADDYE